MMNEENPSIEPDDQLMMCVCVGAGIFSFGIFLAVAAHHTHTKLLAATRTHFGLL
jgi:hypothetical protein